MIFNSELTELMYDNSLMVSKPNCVDKSINGLVLRLAFETSRVCTTLLRSLDW